MVERQQDYVLRSVEERGVRLVRLWFTDVLGQLKSFAISPAELENAFDEGRPTYRAYVVKSYRDHRGDWQETSAFRPDDLVLASDLARRAADWILAREGD